jgi:excinuclease ABC subunit C
VLALDRALDFDPVGEADFFSALPSAAAVCLIELKEPSAQPLFIRTQDLRRRLQRLLGPPDPASKRLNLRGFAKSVRYRLTPTLFEQTFAYYQQAKQRFPSRYLEMLKMRPPAVLKVNLRNAYPRCYATRKIPLDARRVPYGGVYYGPFPSRKSAEAFAEGVLDLFKVRRCQIKIRRDPDFPGCIYSEMKMCLAPCFAGCSKEEYAAEVARLTAFLETGGNSLRENLAAERDRSSQALDFEKASNLHKKLDKLDEALRRRPELTRRIQDLNAVVFQPGAEQQSVAVYEIRGGVIAQPFLLSFAALAGEPRSAEQFLREQLEAQSEPPAGDLSEHLWLLARWYYSNPREGEIFFRENAWPYRRMMRACARILNPADRTKAESAPGQSTAGTQKRERSS